MADKIKGYCSHCLNETNHIEQQWNILRRNSYTCESCRKPTVQCRVCQNFAKGGDFWDDELCAECDQSIVSFHYYSFRKEQQVNDLDEFIELESFPLFLARAQKINRSKFNISKLRSGTGIPVLFIDGFLSDGDTNEQNWLNQLDNINSSCPAYLVTWKSKKIKDLSKTITMSLNPIANGVGALANIAYQWRGAKQNAEQAGILLGEVLASILEQKFILCGHSLGSRVIYHTLKHLNHLNKPNLVKEAHLLGAAISHKYCWKDAVNVVETNIYNYYSENDAVLKFLYTDLGAGNPIGCNVLIVNGVKNKNLSGLVKGLKGHSMYIPNFSKFVSTGLS